MERRSKGKAKRVESDFIYLVSNPLYDGWFKVGITNDPKNRLRHYQVATPYRNYKLEYAKQVYNASELEKMVIDNFKSNNEWLQAKRENIIKFIKKYV